MDTIIASGRHAILDIEVQGASIVRQRRGDVVSIFILPPNARGLAERLAGRETEGSEELAKRLRAAVGELKEASKFDFVVTNETVTDAVAEVAAIIDSGVGRAGHAGNLQEQLDELSSGLEIEADRLSAE